MINLWLGAVVGFFASLAFVFLPVVKSANSLILQLGKFIYITGLPAVDDERMQQLLNKQFFRVFGSLSSLIFWLSTFLLFSGGLVWLLYFAAGITGSLVQFIASGWFLLGSFVGILPAIGVVKLIDGKRKKRDEQVDPYSQFSKFLHYVFLGNPLVAKLLFAIWNPEKKLAAKYAGKQPAKAQAVYVAGLARAGTTVIMQSLGKLGAFSSITYNDLPLLFLPTGAADDDTRHTEHKKVERAHGDGVMHSLDSYEALEEPFWRNFQSNYIQEHTLVVQEVELATYQKYQAFRRWYGKGKIYLCKNNNHLLRAASLDSLDRTAGFQNKTIIPFRHPVTHAKSLLAQHKHLSAMQQSDVFVLDYMDMLVHNEFGLGRKQSVFDEFDELPDADWNTLEAWINYWYNYYQAIFQLYKDNDNFAFVQYEGFCLEPEHTLKSIFDFIGIPPGELTGIEPYQPRLADTISMDDKVLALYNQMSKAAINRQH